MTSSDRPQKPSASWFNWRTRLILITLILLVTGATLEYYIQYSSPPPLRAAGKDFLIKPYLQFGKETDGSGAEIAWASPDDGETRNWQFEIYQRGTATGPVKTMPVIESKPVAIEGLPRFKTFSAAVPTIMTSERDQQYYLRKNGQVVFQATLHRLNYGKAPNQTLRFDVAGDLASGLGSERMVAKELFNSRPNFVVIPGDIVYNFGRTLEYLDHFFPVYNADQTSLEGVPAIRSTMFIAAPGNHDIEMGARFDTRNLDQFPDGLAYFYLWNQPTNGPQLKRGGPNTSVAHGSAQHLRAFEEAAGDRYPSMANFSLDIANCHFTCMDANPYVNWQDPEMRGWVERDLQAATKRGAQWKFVVFHQASFSSDTHHFLDQQMRVLSDVFERNHVDIVFSGHVHNYQRTYPLHFKPKPAASGALRHPDGSVEGTLQLDKKFDGLKDTHPDGVIYMVTGCGGATMTGGSIAADQKLWQPFTQHFLLQFSFTQCDVEGKRLIVRQIGANGKELDHFEIDKSSGP
jgi:hypothetical protein